MMQDAVMQQGAKLEDAKMSKCDRRRDVRSFTTVMSHAVEHRPPRHGAVGNTTHTPPPCYSVPPS
jgi:hypothetical protein